MPDWGEAWRKDCIRQYGSQYTDPNEVEQEFHELINNAFILGRPDLAKELGERISSDFYKAYAPLLKVIMLLARDPLHQPLPAFSAFTAEDSKSELQKWQQLLAPAEDPQTWQFDSDYEESDVSMELVCHENSTAKDEHELKQERESKKDEAESVLIEESNASSRDTLKRLGEKYAVRGNKSIYGPPVLSTTDFVQDLRLAMIGLPSGNGQLNGVTPECSDSIHRQFRQIGSCLNKNPLECGSMKSCFDEQNKPCTTVIQMLLEAESLLGTDCEGPNHADLNGVRRWVAGDFISWPVSESQLFNWCPRYFHHPNLYRTCIYGYLIKHLYHRSIHPLKFEFENSAQFHEQLSLQYFRNAMQLMDCGLRKQLSDSWMRLSSIFLAQDPRILMLLDVWAHEVTSSTRSKSLNAILLQVWPGADFHFDVHGKPQVALDLPELVVQVFGSNFGQLFKPNALQDAWFKIMKAFEDHEQIVELQMAETASQVKTNIESCLMPTIYFPLKQY